MDGQSHQQLVGDIYLQVMSKGRQGDENDHGEQSIVFSLKRDNGE